MQTDASQTTETGSPEAGTEHASATPTSEGQLRSSFWTVGRKLVAVVAVLLSVGFVVMVVLQAFNKNEDLTRLAIANNKTITALLAGEIFGAVQWRKAERIDPVYQRFESDDATTMATFTVFDAEGAVLSDHANERLDGYTLSAILQTDRVQGAEGAVSFMEGSHNIVVAPVTSSKDGKRVGTIAVAWSLAGLQAGIRSAIAIQSALAVGIFAIAVTLLFFLMNRVVIGPLNGLTGVMKRLSGGDHEFDVVGMERTDEIGEMAHAVEVFKQNAIEMERMEAERKETEIRTQREKEAADRKAAEEKKQAMHELASNFEVSVKGIVETVSSASTEMQSTAGSMSETAEQTTQQATTVAAASEEASTNVQTVASAAEEMSSSIDEIGRQVTQSTEIAQKAVDEATHTNETVQGLAEAAQKIGEVVNLISDIAEQTNLLALNATIEAARAGDAGKGFAVVASEVKSLANQTAKATEEIAAQIGSMQSVTGEAVQAIEGIGSTIGQISEIATAISAAVEEQGTATQEIARNVQEAARGTTEVTSNITGVNQAATETGNSAKEVLGAAGELSKQSEKLNAEVDRFLSEIRAA